MHSSNTKIYCFQQTEGETESGQQANGVPKVGTSGAPSSSTALVPLEQKTAGQSSQAKRLHVSNIPFRFREPDLRAMFGVSQILIYL